MPFSKAELLTITEENPESLFQLLATHMPQASFTRDAQLRKMCFGVPVPFFNGIAMARFAEQNCDDLIQQAKTEMDGTGMPWSWQIGPCSSPQDLGKRLTEHGMLFSHEMPIMTTILQDWKPQRPPANLEIIPVNDASRYEDWMDVAQIAFGLPTMVFDVFR